MARSATTKVIVLGPRGYLSAKDDLVETAMSTRLGFQKTAWEGQISFHADGQKYAIASARLVHSLPPWAKYLPTLLYNPFVRVMYEYRAIGRYEIGELLSGVQAAIDEDDDIITQFREREDLLARLSQARDFAAVASVLAYARVGR